MSQVIGLICARVALDKIGFVGNTERMVSNSQVAQRRSDGSGAVCTVCRHDRYPDIRARLDAGARVADISSEFDLSLSSIYRHRSNRHDALALLPLDAADGLTLAERLDLMFNRATAGSEGLYLSGDVRGAALVGDHALRTAGALAALGIDSDTIKGEIQHALEIRRRAVSLYRTLQEYLDSNPDQADALLHAAERAGAHALAAQLRDDDPEEQQP